MQLKRKLKKKALSDLTENLRALATQCGCPFVEHDLVEGPVNPTPAGGYSDDASAQSADPQASPPGSIGPGDSTPPQDQNLQSPIVDDSEGTDFNPATDKEKQDKKKCLCPSCPTYARGAQNQQPPELTYCEAGTSNLKPVLRGCLCPSCPVYSESKLLGWYFCATSRAETVSDLSGQGTAEPVSPELQSQTTTGPDMTGPAGLPTQNVSAPAAPSAISPNRT